MDRLFVYPGQVPLDTDVLAGQAYAYEAISAVLGLLSDDGTPLIRGFEVTPGSGLAVNVAPGVIIAPGQVFDAAPYGSIGTNSRTVVKQGQLKAAAPLGGMVAPGVGLAVYYLVQVGFTTVDTDTSVLPYYNASNPTVAWPGPGGSNVAQAKRRADQAVVSLKMGTAASSPTPPTPDDGFVGAFLVHVAAGQSSILTGDITVYNNGSGFFGGKAAGFSINGLAPKDSPVFTGGPTAPTPTAGDSSFLLATTAFVAAALAATASLIGTHTGLSAYLSSASNTLAFTADEVVTGSALGGAVKKVNSVSLTANLATTGANGMDTGTAPISGFVAVYLCTGTSGNCLLVQDVSSSVAPPVYAGGHAVTGYSATSALLAVLPTDGTGKFSPMLLNGRRCSFAPVQVVNSSSTSGSYTSVSIAAAVPRNAKRALGQAEAESTGGVGSPLTMLLAADAAGAGEQGYVSQYSGGAAPFNVDIHTAQTLYWKGTAPSTPSLSARVGAYEI